jgi:hypothetical protein
MNQIMKFLFTFFLFLAISLKANSQIIEGYTDKQSYRVCETVNVFANNVQAIKSLQL